MVFRSCLAPGLTAGLILLLSAATGSSQQAKAPIVQPGTPGENSKILSSVTPAAPREPLKADVDFMQGMIMHHGQAVEMVALLRTRGRSKDLQSLGKRISISQTDEMQFMKQWLEDRGKPTTMQMDHSKMDHSKMSAGSMASMMMMPGMLTPAQMKELAASRGAKFDHLFLTGMIQHHKGALTMVEDLFALPATGQDSVLYDFATDVDNTQRAEINIMQGMLAKEKR